jgi:crotonobetainyl-CoA:carnitine CoA-transferase CaiB-like acyl-CoA transferase
VVDCDGCDVIKVESAQRPDGIRFSAAVSPKVESRFYEMSGLFHATNLGKRASRSISASEGIAIAKQLIERSDIVCENFTPASWTRSARLRRDAPFAPT